MTSTPIHAARGALRAVRIAAQQQAAHAPRGLGDYPGPLLSLLRGGLSAGAGMLVVLLGARLLRVREVTTLVDTVAARLRRG